MTLVEALKLYTMYINAPAKVMYCIERKNEIIVHVLTETVLVTSATLL